MRHQANDAVGRYGVQLSQTDRGAQGVAGVCSVGAGGNAIASVRSRKTSSRHETECVADEGGHDGHLADVEGQREAIALTAEVVSRA